MLENKTVGFLKEKENHYFCVEHKPVSFDREIKRNDKLDWPRQCRICKQTLTTNLSEQGIMSVIFSLQILRDHFTLGNMPQNERTEKYLVYVESFLEKCKTIWKDHLTHPLHKESLAVLEQFIKEYRQGKTQFIEPKSPYMEKYGKPEKKDSLKPKKKERKTDGENLCKKEKDG